MTKVIAPPIMYDGFLLGVWGQVRDSLSQSVLFAATLLPMSETRKDGLLS
ncbi:hypothetical protein [Rhizobium rhizophilum]|nr:hypothetical protein [Rhizobium rhizophilum]